MLGCTPFKYLQKNVQVCVNTTLMFNLLVSNRTLIDEQNPLILEQINQITKHQMHLFFSLYRKRNT